MKKSVERLIGARQALFLSLSLSLSLSFGIYLKGKRGKKKRGGALKKPVATSLPYFGYNGER